MGSIVAFSFFFMLPLSFKYSVSFFSCDDWCYHSLIVPRIPLSSSLVFLFNKGAVLLQLLAGVNTLTFIAYLEYI